MQSLLTGFLDEISKLKKLRAEVAELSGKQKTFSKQSKKTISTLKNNTAALDKENKKQAELKHQLQADEKALKAMAQGNTPDDIECLKTRAARARQGLSDTLQSGPKKSNTDWRFRFFLPISDVKNSRIMMPMTLSLDLEKLRQEIKREENIKRVLDEKIILEALLKKMAPDRIHLVDGKPCPFCGALQHPYAKYPPAVSNSKQALIDQKAENKVVNGEGHQIQNAKSVPHKSILKKIRPGKCSYSRSEPSG